MTAPREGAGWGGCCGPAILVVVIGVVLLAWGSGRFSWESSVETYVLPAGYRGAVHVVFDQPNGAPAKHLSGRRVYEIPPSGVLFTRFRPRRRGWLTPEFRYGAPDGPSIPMASRAAGVPPGDPVVVARVASAWPGARYSEGWRVARASEQSE